MDSGGERLPRLIETHDWAGTSLGPSASWPQSLRTVTGILATSRFAMWMSWGPELTFLYNDAYAPTLGVKHPWALGRPSHEVWAEIWPDIGPRIQRVLDTGEATWDEALLLFLERSGYTEETYHTFSYSPLRDEGERVAGHLCVVTEETERVISTRRLSTLRDLAAAIARATGEAAVVAAIGRELGRNLRDLPFAVLYLADDEGLLRLAALTGFDGEALPQPLAAAAAWGEPATGRAAAVPLAAIAPGVSFPRGAWSEAPSEALPIAIPGAAEDRPAGLLVAGLNPHRRLDPAYRDFLGLLAGQVGSAIANARSFEAARRRAEALAELDRAKTAFFSNVSHEFRTPLTLMLGPIAEAAGRAATEAPSLAPLLDVAHRNARRLLRLVNSLLEFARIEAGRVEARFVPVDLPALTVDLASTFRSAMEAGGLRFEVVCAALPAPAFVDPGMWERIVLNLLSNAFKFTLEGEVRLSLEPAPDGRAVVLSVRDTGVGIPADQVGRVFDRFHRVEGANGRSHEGSGIGLALVRDLVALHGGTIEVASTPGAGSTFRVTLPLGDAHLPAERIGDAVPGARGSESPLGAAFLEEAHGWLDPPEPASPAPPEPARAAATAPGTRRGRILLADDNADMRGYIARLLGEAGHEVIAVADGQAALARLRAGETFDLVLSDVMMPRLDGLGLLRAVRGDRALRDTTLILLSARAGEEARVEALSAEADDYLVKPFSARELVARVSAQLAASSARREVVEALAQDVAERTAERDRLWDLSEDLLFRADSEGRLLRVSPSWTRSVGIEPPALLDRDFWSLVHPEDREATREAIATMLRTRVPVRLQNRLAGRTEARPAWIAWSLTPDSNGIDAFLGIGRDVTAERDASDALVAQIEERERVEATLRQMQRLEAVGQLTSGVAHDFNNLLTVILGSIEQLERHLDADQPALRRRLDMMQTAARRGADLTGQLLAFARKQHLDPRALDLNETVRGMSELLRTTVGGTVAVRVSLEPHLWPALADRTQIELAVLNLAINARDAMERGGTLTVETANARLRVPATPEQPGPGQYVMVAVGDTGTGIPPEVLERVFEPFFTTKPPGKGSGLGLAQVYGFAKQSGGGVAIETSPGRGTTVRIYLPRARDETPDAVGNADGAGRPQILETARVLLVDDDGDVRETTRLMLEDFGLAVMEAPGAEAALAMVEDGVAFDLLLLDFAMPGMNGADLARAVEQRRGRVPIVMVTGYADPSALQGAGGSWPIVFKPFRREELARALEEALGRAV